MDDETSIKENFAGKKEWNCDITLNSRAKDGTIIHELLHSMSVSHYTKEQYATFAKGTEEGVVQLWTEIICEESGIEYNHSYPDNVRTLRQLNKILWPDMPEKEYSSMLFEMPLEDRFDFLQDSMAKYMLKRGDATAQDFLEVKQYLDKLWEGC